MNLVACAQNYANADRSDPFAYKRAICHLKNGISSRYTHEGKEGFYNAEPFQETRMLPDGREYNITVYRNIIRP